jgi:hypothetical protein
MITAQRLRAVRRASLLFLDQWAVGKLYSSPSHVDRVAADVLARANAALADPDNHDWSLLYRGSVLDD